MSKKPFWEKSYKNKNLIDTYLCGQPSSEFYDLIKLLPRNVKVLDLGCGDGRNAIFLAENGFDVRAVDISMAGIEKLNHLARIKDLHIEMERRDMRDYVFKGSYDLIIAHGCLHLIERSYWIRLIKSIKSRTRTGGYNVIAAFTDTLPPPADLKDFTVGLFREGELFEIYQDWQIILQKSYIKEDEHPGSIKHRHPINKIVAKKLRDGSR